MNRILATMLILAGWFVCSLADACTITVVGRTASADGSVIASHSDDGLGDGRMIYIPAMDHRAGALRPVFYSHCALDFKPQWGSQPAARPERVAPTKAKETVKPPQREAVEKPREQKPVEKQVEKPKGAKPSEEDLEKRSERKPPEKEGKKPKE